jgi:hypothetical protein
MIQVYVAVAIALACFILYAIDRRMKQEPIDMLTAAKISILGGALSGGAAYISTAPEVVKEVIKEAAPVAQEMFVGVPSF